MALAAVVIALGLSRLASVAGWLHIVAKYPNLIAVTVGLWSVEAILFTLTAALTALLVNLYADPDERSLLMERYRSRAFDAVAALSLVIVVLTGYALLQMLGAEVLTLDVTEVSVRTAVLFLVDVLALAWLLYYSHLLISRAAQQRSANLLRLLRDSFREAAVQEVSGTLLESWGASRGLAIVSSLAGFRSNMVPVTAPRAAYLYDVSLDRLELWLRSLKHSVSSESTMRAQARIRLNADLAQGVDLAATTQADLQKGPGLLSALRWKTEMPADPFPPALGALHDSAATAARSGFLAEFRKHLSTLQSLHTEVFRLSSGAHQLTSQWFTHLFGLQPSLQLRLALFRLGDQVLRTGSAEVVGAWLYFPHKLLRETREYSGRDVRPFFFLWEQVAARGRVPAEWGFWLRLFEYTTSLNMSLMSAGNAEALERVTPEAFGLLLALRNMIVSVETPFFPHISQAVERIGEHFLNGPGAAAVDDNLAAARSAFADRFVGYKRVFWLGFAGWLFRKLGQGQLPQADALKHWETIRQHFHTLDQLWKAWRVLGDADPFQWDYEESREHRAESEAQGGITWGGFVDPFASSTVPFILLGLNLAPAYALAPDDQARPLLGNEIQPNMTQMLADGDLKWEPFVGHLGDRSLADRMNGLRQRILDSAAAAVPGQVAPS